MQEAWIIWLFAYALGSISPAYFIGRKILKKDLRKLGTGNLGAQNVLINVGVFGYVLCAAFDVIKGIISVLVAAYFGLPEYALYVAGLCAVLGHCFPFYLGFRGGKGMATTIGAIGTLWGIYLIFGVLKFEVLVLVTGALFVFYTLFMVYLTFRYKKKIEKLGERQQKIDELHQRLLLQETKRKKSKPEQPSQQKLE